jgi:hypothetical protein
MAVGIWGEVMRDVRQVNHPQSKKELAALRRCVQRGASFGREQWVQSMARQLGLDSTLRFLPWLLSAPSYPSLYAIITVRYADRRTLLGAKP